MRVGLVGCVKTKRDAAAPAKDLYKSPLFLGRRRAVEESCDEWFILSAKHGLLVPDVIVQPYDVAMSAIPRRRRREWSGLVLEDLRSRLGPLAPHTFEIHAGADYWNWGLREGLSNDGATVTVPTEGLNQGQSLAYYRGDTPTRASRTRSPSGASGGGRYAALTEYLGRLGSRVWEASFADVEEILGRQLPASARRHAAWWGNSDSHSHARAWLTAGFETSSVNLTAERVTFERRQ